MKQAVGNNLNVEVEWVVKERVGSGWTIVQRVYNTITQYGLTALSGASPATFMLVDNNFQNTTLPLVQGATSVVLAGDPTLGGDNQLVLDIGSSAQETVSYSVKSGSGPFTFTLNSGTLNAHASGIACTRPALQADTLASVISEQQYDATYFPNLRNAMSASYSPGLGQFTYQFFFAGIQATNLLFAHVGLCDKQTVGTGNLHNYAILGYNHNNTNDVEVDVIYTLTGN